MCRTLLEGVWLSDIGRMAEVRNVPHLARKVWLRGRQRFRLIIGKFYKLFKLCRRQLALAIFAGRHAEGPAEGVVERLARGKARTEGDFLARCIGVARVAQQLAGKAQTIARDHGRKVLALAPFVDGLGQQARRYAKMLGHGAGIAVGVAIGPLLRQRMANRGVEFLQPLAAHSLSPREKLARTIG